MNAEAVVDQDDAMLAALGPDQCTVAWTEARKHLHGEHHKCEHIQGQINAALETAEVNRPQNVRQRAEGIAMTVQTMDLIAHSKVTDKGGHRSALETELKKRDYHELRCPMSHPEEKKRNKQKLFTASKDKLIELEIARVNEDGSNEAVLAIAGKKAFKKL